MEQSFYKMFVERLRPDKLYNEEELVISEETMTYAECYKSPSKWTKVIKTELERLIKDYWKCIHDKPGIRVQKEYFRTDLSGWVDRKEELKDVKTGMNKHLWDLQIVVEHENDPKNWIRWPNG